MLRYTVEWIGREGLDPETHSEYLQHFITHFYRNMVKLVDRAMRKEDSSAQGQIITEILQHLHACNNSVKVSFKTIKSSKLVRREFFLSGILWTRGHFGENKELHAGQQRQAIGAVRGRWMRQDISASEKRRFDEQQLAHR